MVSQLRDGQTLILRSTVFPGITRHVKQYLQRQDLDIAVAFCPERVAEGFSIREFRTLPLIVGATEQTTRDAVRALFGSFTDDFIEMQPIEAELCKLMNMADLSDDYANVEDMIAKAEAGADVVCGSRYMPGGRQIGGPWLKRQLSWLAGMSLYGIGSEIG